MSFAVSSLALSLLSLSECVRPSVLQLPPLRGARLVLFCYTMSPLIVIWFELWHQLPSPLLSSLDVGGFYSSSLCLGSTAGFLEGT